MDKIVEGVKAHMAHIAPHHGWVHIERVWNNILDALLVEELSFDQETIVVAAGLMHDVDDHKLYPESRDYQYARSMLIAAEVPADLHRPIIDCIKLVGCSTESHYSATIVHTQWMLIPRDADRLDALGAEGVRRCIDFGTEQGRPLFVESTLLPATKAEMVACATPARLAKIKEGKKSDSTIDHFYDKILQLTSHDSGNSVLAAAGVRARQEAIDSFWPVVQQARQSRLLKI